MIIGLTVIAFILALAAADFRGTKKERRAREDRAYFLYHP